MGRRYRQHVNPLKQTALVPRAPLAIPPGPPVEVELGCGDGLFVIDQALRRPGTFFVGLDIRPEFLAPGQQRISALGLENVRLETCNLMVGLADLLPVARVRTFWINFPDPWFKRRQRNRRWFDADALEALVAALEPTGDIIYQSDVWDAAVEALGLLEAHAALGNSWGAFSFAKERLVDQRTSREAACEREGRKIWRMRFRRQ